MFKNWNSIPIPVTVVLIVIYLASLFQNGRAEDLSSRTLARRYTEMVSTKHRYAPPRVGYAYYPRSYPLSGGLEGRLFGLHLTKYENCTQKVILFITYWDCKDRDNQDKLYCFFRKLIPEVLRIVYKTVQGLGKVTDFGVAGYKGQLAVKIVKIVMRIMQRWLIPFVADFLAEQFVKQLGKINQKSIVGLVGYQAITTFFQAFPSEDKECQYAGKPVAGSWKTGENKNKTNTAIVLEFVFPLIVDSIFTAIGPIFPPTLVLSQMPFWPAVQRLITDQVAKWVAKGINKIIADEWFEVPAYLVHDSNEGVLIDQRDTDFLNLVRQWLLNVPAVILS